MVCALKALVGWLILWLIGINLIGFFLRGVALLHNLRDQAEGVEDFIAREYRRRIKFESFLNVLAGAVCIVFPYLLFRWLGWQVAAAGLILMLARLPDLLYEIRSGKRIRRGDMPNSPIHALSIIVMFLVLPLVWWGLCHGRG
jgi:hypothetical protein